MNYLQSPPYPFDDFSVSGREIPFFECVMWNFKQNETVEENVAGVLDVYKELG